MASFLVGFQGCQSYQEPYVVSVSKVQINEANIKRLSISASLEIYNPNNISMDLSRTDLTIISDNLELARIDQSHDIIMPGEANFDFPLSIEVDIKELFEGDVLRALSYGKKILDDRSIDIEIKGHLYAGKDAIQLKVPIDRKETIKF